MISWGSWGHGGKGSTTGVLQQVYTGLLGRPGCEGEKGSFLSCERAAGMHGVLHVRLWDRQQAS